MATGKLKKSTVHKIPLLDVDGYNLNMENYVKHIKYQETWLCGKPVGGT